MQSEPLDKEILEKERKRKFELSRSDRFRYRTRYFTDSGIIGTKEFVSKTYIRFKHVFNRKGTFVLNVHNSWAENIHRSYLDGVYSLKRLAE